MHQILQGIQDLGFGYIAPLEPGGGDGSVRAIAVSLVGAILLLSIVGEAEFVESVSLTDRVRARAHIAAMKAQRRGPYLGVAWHCHDGQVLPPRAGACIEHGGGFQYGVPTAQTQTLARMGIGVGTVLTSLKPSHFVEDDYYWTRAYIVEAYLERALDGWVLSSAKKHLRGFRHAEVERESANLLLIELARDAVLLQKKRSLLLLLSRAMPYGRQGVLADDIRALARLLGDADPGFAPLRSKLHTMPEPTDVQAVRAYSQSREGELGDLSRGLIDKLERFYDPASRAERLRDVRRWLWDRQCRDAIRSFLETDLAQPVQAIKRGAALIALAEKRLSTTASPQQGGRNLLLLHTMSLVEQLWVATVAPLAKMPLTRADAMDLATSLVKSAGVLGLLSTREVDSAVGDLQQMRRGEPAGYVAGFERARRALDWARARVTADLWLPLRRYELVEPLARGVVDDILRSGVMLPMAAVFDRLGADAETLRGGGHRLLGLGELPTTGLRGENPGLAMGRLAVLPPGEPPRGLEAGQIVLLSDLPAELPPVAGILTAQAPGSLSHISLLARNLGIPSASVGTRVAEQLAGRVNEEILLGVSSGRRVILGPVAAAPATLQASLPGRAQPAEPVVAIETNSLDLETSNIRTLAAITSADAGARVGSKSTRLAELRRLFPERVSDGVVIPFAAFFRHTNRSAPDGSPSPWARIQEAYSQTHQKSSVEPPEELLAELARFREAIRTLPFTEGFEGEVREALKPLGELGQFGVFVRSDTNAEDLGGFTGAGLNVTVPHRTELASIMAGIREVWASPYAERAVRWRHLVFENPEGVLPAVILHRSVPAEVSGVMVTMDLEGRVGGALTISASEGVAAVVDGGSPETVVLFADGSLRLLASSRSATRKEIPPLPREGVRLASSRGHDPLLGEKDLSDLCALAEEVAQRLPPEDNLPWDIEFGLVQGKAWLMQIRPLRLSKSAGTHPVLTELDVAMTLPAQKLDLNAALLP